MSERSQKFVDYIIKKVNDEHKGNANAAMLRRGSSPTTEYQAWDILMGFHWNKPINLEDGDERLSFVTIAADIAKVKPKENGTVLITQALLRCYHKEKEFVSADKIEPQPKVKLRRLLACETTVEVCQVLRPLLSLIESKANVNLNYAQLLDDLLWFSYDESRQRIKAKWAQNFYGKQVEETAND